TARAAAKRPRHPAAPRGVPPRKRPRKEPPPKPPWLRTSDAAASWRYLRDVASACPFYLDRRREPRNVPYWPLAALQLGCRMSAFGGKADMGSGGRNVYFLPEAANYEQK